MGALVAGPGSEHTHQCRYVAAKVPSVGCLVPDEMLELQLFHLKSIWMKRDSSKVTRHFQQIQHVKC